MKTKTIKITGVKKAMSEYNQCDNWKLFGLFYLDTATGEIWCNTYTDCNSWTHYHNENIICLQPGEYVSLDWNEKITMATLKLACERAIEENSMK